MSFLKNNAPAGSQLSAFGNYLSAPREGNELENMFGPYGRNAATANDFDYYFRDHKQSRDFRAQLGAILTEITTGLVMRFPSAPLQLLPIVITDQLQILIHRQEYTGGLFGEVPEEGVTRTLVQTEVSEMHALIRRGLAVRVESTALVLPAAQQQFRNAVENLSISAAETMVVVALRRMLEAGHRSSGFVSYFRQNADPLEIARREAELTGAMQSRQFRLVSLMKDLHGELKANLNGASPEFADLLVPHVAVKYLETENRQRSELEGIDLRTEIFGTPTVGQVLSPFLVTAGGVRCWDIPAERAARLGRGRVDQVARNILEAQQVFAEWTPAFWEHGNNIFDGVTHTNEKDAYTSDLRNVVVFSCEPQGLVELSFGDILYNGGAGRMPHPSKAGYTLKPEHFTGHNEDGKRNVPWCWYREPSIPDGQEGWCDSLSVFGQADENVFSFHDFRMMGQSFLAEVAKAVGGVEQLNRNLNIASSILAQQAKKPITAEAVNAIIQENGPAFENPEVVTSVAPIAAAQSGWPSIRQARANPTTGTLSPADDNSFGFASFYGLRAMLDSGLGGNANDIAAVLATFEAIERVAKSTNSGTIWAQEGARPSWFPHAQQGAMAFASVTGEAQIPLFVRTNATGAINTDDILGSEIVPYMKIGVDAMDRSNPVDSDVVPDAVRGLVDAVQRYNRDNLKYGRNADSNFFGANKLVVLQDSSNTGNDYAVVVPADFAYCAAFMLGENNAAAKLSRETVELYITHVQGLVRAGRTDLVEEYAAALYSADEVYARGAVKYAQQEAVKSGTVTGVQVAIDALKSTSTSGKKKTKSDALDAIKKLGADDAGPAAGAFASGVLVADANLLSDYNVWKARSPRFAQNATDFPFASAGAEDAGCAKLVLRALKQAKASGSNYWPYSVTAPADRLISDRRTTVLQRAQPDTELAKAFLAEIDELSGTGKKRGELATESATRQQARAGQSRAQGGGEWLRTPLVVSREQAIQLARGDYNLKPGNPETGYASPFLDGSAEAAFHSGMQHISALATGDHRRSSIHVGLEVSKKLHEQKIGAEAGSGRGDAASKIGGHLGRTGFVGALAAAADKPGKGSNPLRRIFASTNFQRNLAGAARITQPALQMAYLMVLGMRCDHWRFFQEMVDSNIHVPLAGIIFRPKLVLRCASLLLLVGGRETGINYAGDFNSMFGTDTKIKVSELNVTMRHETVINDPNRIMPAFNLLITGCISGGGVSMGNPFDNNHKAADLYCALIPVQEQASVPYEINISGRFTFNSRSTPAANRLHYSSAPLLNNKMGLSKKYAAHNQGREGEVYLERRRVRLPEIFLRASYAVRSNHTQGRFVMRVGHSLAARNAAFYDRAYDAFIGNGEILRDVDDTARDIATIGCNPMKVMSHAYKNGGVHSGGHHNDGMHMY